MVALWLLGYYGVMAKVGVGLSTGLSEYGMYRTVVHGGLWGFLFFLPMLNGALIRKGMVLALLPALFELLFVYPRQGHGWFAVNLGILAPLVIALKWQLWGLVAALVNRS